MISRSLRFGSAIPALLVVSHVLSAEVAPHDVPAEFEATQYVVAVNNVPVKVFHAGLNVYFASFYFAGTAASAKACCAPVRTSTAPRCWAASSRRCAASRAAAAPPTTSP